MGSSRSVFALAILLAAGCTKEGSSDETSSGPQAEVRVEVGDCAGTEVAFVSGPKPGPAEPAGAEAGAIGMLGTTGGGAFASLTGSADISSGFDDEIHGGLLGNEVGEMQSGFGYGLSGTRPDPGGGGTGWGTIGTGKYGTIGHGSGTGSGYGVGSGRGGMRGRDDKAPDVKIGNAQATGDLDKNIIRRYIRRQLPKVRYCYEKQLLVKPTLAGTVKASFVISAEGQVVESSAEGVDPEVSDCIAGTIKAIQFPRPKGGGIVTVNYPFIFKPAGATEEKVEIAEEDAAKFADALVASDPSGADAEDLSKRKPGADLDRQIREVREGQYKMKSNLDDPQLARQQALDQARSAGILGQLKAADEAAPPLASLGAPTGGGSPLRGHEAELAACFRTQKAAYGVSVVDLTYDASGAVVSSAVHGIDGGEFATCVSAVAAKLKRVAPEGASQRCSVAFGTMPITDAPGVDITADALLWKGQKLLDPASIMMDASPQPKLAPLFDAASAPAAPAAVSIRGPMMVRAIDDARMKVVMRTVVTLQMAGGDPVFAAKQGAGWRLLRDVRLPVVPVPEGTGASWNAVQRKSAAAAAAIVAQPRPQLSILLQKDKSIWVGITPGERVQIAAAADQLAQLEKALAAHKAAAFAARTDVEVAGEDEVTYGEVVKVLDLATRAGFTDWTVTDPNALSVRFVR